jgi:hypothetical protein
MRKRSSRRKLVVALSVVLVACAAPTWAADRAVDQPSTRTAASLRGCVDNHAIRMISFEHADSFLPDGFESADASVILFAWAPVGVPVPQGKSVAVSPGMVCEWSDWERGPVDINWIVIPVRRPSIPGLMLDPTPIDLYLVTFLTSRDQTLERFHKLGYPAVDALTTSVFGTGQDTDVRPTPIGSSTTGDGDGHIVDFDVTGAAAVHSGFKVRVWLQTGRGLGYFSWERTASTVFVGALQSCRVRPASTHALVFGTTDCSTAASGGQDSIGATFSERTDFEGDFRFLPGRGAGR